MRRRRSRRRRFCRRLFGPLRRRGLETALHACELDLVSEPNRLLLDRLAIDARFVGASQIHDGYAVARDEELRVEFADEVVREADPIRWIPPHRYLVAENGVMDFLAVGKLNDQLRDFG